MLSIFVVLTLIYGYVRYNNFQEFKKVVCEENSTLMNDIENSNTTIRNINNIKDLQSSNIFNDLNRDCVAEWTGECGSSNDEQTYSVEMPALGDGVRCEVPHGTTRNCPDDDVSASGTGSGGGGGGDVGGGSGGSGGSGGTSRNLFSLYVLDKLIHGNSANDNNFTFSYFIDSIFSLFRSN
jgi:uncharacterized membrane protein YgcG